MRKNAVEKLPFTPGRREVDERNDLSGDDFVKVEDENAVYRASPSGCDAMRAAPNKGRRDVQFKGTAAAERGIAA